MPEEFDVDTKELQDTIEELQEERKERAETERRAAWTRYIALTTAILAVFAAIAALQAGTLVNEAVLKQLQASDKWNEYQADRTKDHLYSIRSHELLDAGVKRAAREAAAGTATAHRESVGGGEPAGAAAGHVAGGHDQGARAHPKGSGSAEHAAPPKRSDDDLRPLPASARLDRYVEQVRNERTKEGDLITAARDLEHESKHEWHLHHMFAISVALIQVAIALGAVAALTRIKPVWALSLAVGAVGIFFFASGTLAP